jgi:hypothetical protein
MPDYEYIEASILDDYNDEGGVNTDIDVIRRALGPGYMDLTDSQIIRLVNSNLARMSPEEIEGFWDTVKNVGKKVGGFAKQAAPVILPIAGTALGAYLGSPQIGAMVGQAGAQLVSGSKKQPKTAVPPPPVGAPVPSGGSSAVNQLMALVRNPTFLQTLVGQSIGGTGQQNVSRSSQAPMTQIPFGALMSALGSLANTAAIEAANLLEEDEEVTGYLRDEYGNFTCDPANPDERAQRVLQLIREDYLSTMASTQDFDPVTEWTIRAGLIR